MRGASSRAVLVGLGVLLQLWAFALLDRRPGDDLQRHVLLFLGACACYAAALWVVLRLPREGVHFDLSIVFLFAVLQRCLLVLAPPSLSDDVFRAIWDARLLRAAVNPYAHPPGDAVLERYRDEAIWPRINHKEQRTPYPPAAEWLGAGAYGLVPEQTVGFQGMAAGMDLLGAALLALFLHRIGEDPRRCIALAWSPAGALQFAHSGHNDSAMVAALVGASLLLTWERRRLSMGALGLATMVKVVPALAVPAFARATGWPGVLSWAAVCVVVALPFASVGPGLVLGLAQEATEQFNDSLHLLFQRGAQAFAGEAAGSLASALSAGLAGAGALALARWTLPSPRGTLLAGCRALGLYLLVAPVVQPWYLTWLAPLVALEIRPGRGRAPFAFNEAPAWLWLTVASVLTDLTYMPDMAGWWVWIRVAEYAPTYLLLGLAALGYWRSVVHGADPRGAG